MQNISIFSLLQVFSVSVSSELGGLLKYVRPFLNSISKAKAARLVRSLLDMFLDMEAATGQEVELCLECIEWAKAEKRTFLRQALEVRPLLFQWVGMFCGEDSPVAPTRVPNVRKVTLTFAPLLLRLVSSRYTLTRRATRRRYNSVSLRTPWLVVGSFYLDLPPSSPGSQLLQELKKMDDKALLVEVQLLESKTYHALSNLPKARAALTSARTTANAIYCPPKLQAALDMQSGKDDQP